MNTWIQIFQGYFNEKIDFHKYCFLQSFLYQRNKFFFFWNKSIKFSNHIYAKPLIYFHNYPFFCFFSTLNPGEISQIKKLAIIQSRHMYIYIKNICTCANTIYLDICMKSMNGNKLRIALNEILNKTASRYWQHREL